MEGEEDKEGENGGEDYEKMTQMNVVNTEEQGGSFMDTEYFKSIEGEGFDLFNNLDQNINEYQIERDEGTIKVKIATVYKRQNTRPKSAMRIAEEEKAQTKTEVFGQKYNFSVIIDPKTKSGLKGLPATIETKLLAIFTKQEIMADPDKVIQCILEARVLQMPSNEQNELPSPVMPESIQLPSLFKREDPSIYYEVIKRMAKGS